jgi:hypothetical protein
MVINFTIFIPLVPEMLHLKNDHVVSESPFPTTLFDQNFEITISKTKNLKPKLADFFVLFCYFGEPFFEISGSTTDYTVRRGHLCDLVT